MGGGEGLRRGDNEAWRRVGGGKKGGRKKRQQGSEGGREREQGRGREEMEEMGRKYEEMQKRVAGKEMRKRAGEIEISQSLGRTVNLSSPDW